MLLLLLPLLVIALAVSVGRPAAAQCVLDRETLAEDARALPEIAALLAGRERRHGAAYWRWQIARARAALSGSDSGAPVSEADLAAQPAAVEALALALSGSGDATAAEALLARLLAAQPTRAGTWINWALLAGRRAGALAAGAPPFVPPESLVAGASARRRRQLALVARVLAQRQRFKTTLDAAATARRGSAAALWPLDHLLGPGWRLRGANDRPLDSTEIYLKRDARLLLTAYAPGGTLAELRQDVLALLDPEVRPAGALQAPLWETLGDLLCVAKRKPLAYRAYRRAAALLADAHPAQTRLAAAMRDVKTASVAPPEDFAEATIVEEERAGASYREAWRLFEDDLVRRGEDPSDTKWQIAFTQEFAREAQQHEARGRDQLWQFVGVGLGMGLVLAVIWTGVCRRRRRHGARSRTD